MHRRRLALVIASLAGLAATSLSATAATPKSGHIGPKAPVLHWQTAQQVFSPAHLVIGNGGVLALACPPAELDPADAVCDHFTITVDVPLSYWNTHHGGLSVTVPDDFSGYAYDSEGRIAAAERWTGEVREMRIPNAAGSYEIRLAPYLAFGVYPMTARFLSAPGKDGGFPRPGSDSYHARAMSTLPSSAPANKAVAYDGPDPDYRTTRIGHGAAEPSIGADRYGYAYFAAATYDSVGGEPRTELLRSTNQNRSWQSIQPKLGSTGQDSHPLTLDPYVYVDKDYGRIFDVDLVVGGSYLDFSDDRGSSWTRGMATSPLGVNDHQTLFAGRPPLETGLAITLDTKFPKFVYYCVNQVDGTFCNRSLDGGKSFIPTGAPPFPGVQTSGSGASECGGLSGQGVADSTGRIFLPRGFCDQAELAMSSDAGLSWTVTRVAPNIPTAGTQTAVAVDSANNVYYVWWDAKYKLPWLAVSRDHGLHFGTPRMIAPPGVKAVNFPAIDAGSSGRIAITFPGTEGADSHDLTRPWNQYVVLSTDALSDDPTFLSAVVNPGGVDDPIHRGDCLNRCGRMLDFIDVVVAPDYRGTVWVTTTDSCTSQDSCSTQRKAGYYAGTREYGVATDDQGIAVMQIGGPPMRVSR